MLIAIPADLTADHPVTDVPQPVTSWSVADATFANRHLSEQTFTMTADWLCGVVTADDIGVRAICEQGRPVLVLFEGPRAQAARHLRDAISDYLSAAYLETGDANLSDRFEMVLTVTGCMSSASIGAGERQRSIRVYRAARWTYFHPISGKLQTGGLIPGDAASVLEEVGR